MSTPTIPDHYTETWDTSWVAALQTDESMLMDTVTPDTIGGDRKWYNIGGTVVYKRKSARYAETTYISYETGKSWIYPEEWDAPILQDEWDFAFLDTIVVPTSRIMMDQASAYNRLRDAYARDAIQGTRTTGTTGQTTETFPSANVIDVNYGGGGDVGLTWGKITQAKKLMDLLRIPKRDRYFAIGANQVQDLMSIAQATDRDYANTALIVAGEIHGTLWAGFNWRQYEDLEFDASDADARQCLAYYKPDIILAESGMKTYMDILPQRSHALQIRPSVKVASGRINNSSLIVKCLEA
jgi:hypothetical protein